MKIILTAIITILQVISIIIPLNGKLSDNRKNFPKNLTKKGISFVFTNILFLFFAIILFVISENESNLKDAKLTSATDSLKISQRKIEENGIQIFKLTAKSDSFQRSAYLNSMGVSQQIQESQKIALEKSDKLDKANQKIISLQDDFSKNVIGDGFPIMRTNVSPNKVLNYSLETSGDYPVTTTCKIIDLEKLMRCENVEENEAISFKKSCFQSSILFERETATYLSNVANFLIFTTPQKELKLLTLFYANKNRIVQYSFITFDEAKNKWVHIYRTYKQSSDGTKYVQLLKESHPNMDTRFFIMNLPTFLKIINVDYDQ